MYRDTFFSFSILSSVISFMILFKFFTYDTVIYEPILKYYLYGDLINCSILSLIVLLLYLYKFVNFYFKRNYYINFFLDFLETVSTFLALIYIFHQAFRILWFLPMLVLNKSLINLVMEEEKRQLVFLFFSNWIVTLIQLFSAYKESNIDNLEEFQKNNRETGKEFRSMKDSKKVRSRKI